MLFNLLRKLVEQAASDEARHVLPDVSSLCSSVYCQIDVLDASGGDLRDEFACAWVHDIESFATLRVLPLPINEQLVAQGVGLSWCGL